MTSNDLFQDAQHSFVSGEFEKSVELFSKAEAEGCNPVNAYLSRGAAYLNMKDFDKAIEDFGRVLEIDTDNERAFYYRGVAHLNKGDFNEAVNDLSRSIALNHDRGAAFLARGLANAELGRDEEALRDLKTAVVFSDIEVEGFTNHFGSNRTMFDKSMALLEGERGPWRIVLDKLEAEKLRKWIEQ